MSRLTSALAALLMACLLLPLVSCSANQPQSIVETEFAPASPAREQSDSLQRFEPADYPRVVQMQGGTVTIHHPQFEDWKEFETLTSWVAVEVLEKGATDPWIGSVLVAADTDVNFDERLVIMHDWEFLERKFPEGEPTENARKLAKQAISLSPRAVLLDVLIRALPGDFDVPGQGRLPADLNFDPPRIVVSTKPLQLMLINGDPVAAPIEDTRLEFLVNTNWDVFHDTSRGNWYVLNDGYWQISDDLAGGEWRTTTQVPAALSQLPRDANWSEVRAALPATMPDREPAPFVVSTEPAELILLDGAPALAPITGTTVRYVSNTQSDLFELEGRYYYLVAGRWFTAGRLDGDWTAAGDLPQAFAQIPPEHDKGHVLSSVPGTMEAKAARIEATIPRTASISREAGETLEVTYAGDPEFVEIEGTNLRRAVNTSFQVIAYAGRYYVCHEAVWYVSSQPDGPWTVATEVPEEIYRIPASDPAHNATYVYVDDYDDDYVDYAYTGGYTGTYTTSVSIVYGTGWYYYPWVYWYPWGYPGYWYYPPTYGYGAWYNPATGRYGERAVAYGPYGGAASTAVYNPKTGSYLRANSVWDSDELARSGYGYNPRTNTVAAGNMYYDFDKDKGWRESYVQRGDNWIYGETDIDGNQRTTEYETSRGVEGTSQRERNDGTMTGSGTIEGENRSAQTSSRIDDQGASLNIEGSGGGNVDVSKERGQAGRDISGTTSGGTEFTGESRRTESGAVNTRLESETGGQAAIRRNDGNRSFVGESSGGDLYAGRNGDVYRKGDDGWQKYENGGWSDVRSSGGRSGYSVQSDIERSRSGQYDRGQYDRGQYNRSQYDRSQLNRQYDARRNGQRNYQNYQMQRGAYQRGARPMPRGGRRR